LDGDGITNTSSKGPSSASNLILVARVQVDDDSSIAQSTSLYLAVARVVQNDPDAPTISQSRRKQIAREFKYATIEFSRLLVSQNGVSPADNSLRIFRRVHMVPLAVKASRRYSRHPKRKHAKLQGLS
jgi:hypothetical protein